MNKFYYICFYLPVSTLGAGANVQLRTVNGCALMQLCGGHTA